MDSGLLKMSVMFLDFNDISIQCSVPPSNEVQVQVDLPTNNHSDGSGAFWISLIGRKFQCMHTLYSDWYNLMSMFTFYYFNVS